jgi:hypothetical protein
MRQSAPHRTGLCFCLLLAATPPAHGVEYRARIDTAFRSLEVAACFDSPAPRAVSASFESAPRYLREVRVDGVTLPAGAGADGQLPLGGAARPCLEYTVDARAAARALRFPNLGGARRGYVLLDPGDWLWLPPSGSATPVFIQFDLPEGMSASAPWPIAGENRFRIEGAMRDWSSVVAIGRMHAESLAVPGSTLRFAMVEGAPPADSAFVSDWIRKGAEALTTIYGAFPVPSPQILVVPIGRGGEPVPWGEVQRGGGVGAHLYIDQTRPAAEFAGDWVLVHELSHLLHPNLGADSAWLAEGLATYYQYVARARAGMLTEQEAWQKLHEGFARGRQQTRPGVDLLAATRSMREERKFMRVYWTGTALALLADLSLREAGGSLDQLLARFRDCCLAEPRSWETGEFLRRLDQLGGTDILAELARRHVHSDAFPDLGDAYARLGLRDVNGRIELDAGPRAAALRHAIMGPPD